jgi:hypothetical protein
MLKISAMLSLVIFVITSAFWIWSWTGDRGLYWTKQNTDATAYHRTYISFEVALGEILANIDQSSLLQGRDRFIEENAPGGFGIISDPRPFDISSQFIWGFQFRKTSSNVFGYRDTEWIISLPASVILLASLVMPAIWYRSIVIHRRQISNGLCAICGYDLRATPDLCPECGTKPSMKQENSS